MQQHTLRLASRLLLSRGNLMPKFFQLSPTQCTETQCNAMTQCYSYSDSQQQRCINSYLSCMEKSSATLSSSQLSSHTCLSCWSSSWAVQSVWGGQPYEKAVNNDK